MSKVRRTLCLLPAIARIPFLDLQLFLVFSTEGVAWTLRFTCAHGTILFEAHSKAVCSMWFLLNFHAFAGECVV